MIDSLIQEKKIGSFNLTIPSNSGGSFSSDSNEEMISALDTISDNDLQEAGEILENDKRIELIMALDAISDNDLQEAGEVLENNKKKSLQQEKEMLKKLCEIWEKCGYERWEELCRIWKEYGGYEEWGKFLEAREGFEEREAEKALLNKGNLDLFDREKKSKFEKSPEKTQRQKNTTDLLMENLSGGKKEYTIGYKKMEEFVENYYAKKGKNVKLKITYMMDNDDGIYHGPNTFVTITEIVSIHGINISEKIETGVEGLKKIVSSILESEGVKLVDLRSNATTTSEIVGFGMGEHREKRMTGKTFTIVAKKK